MKKPLAHRPFTPENLGAIPTPEPQELRKEYRKGETAFIRDCLFGDEAPRPQEVEQRATELRKKHPDLASNILELLAAAAWHDASNIDETIFYAWMEGRLVRSGREMKDVTPEEFRKLYKAFPGRKQLEESEGRAQELYKVPSHGYWEKGYFDQSDGLAYRIDLEDRIARQRLPLEQGKARQAELLSVLRKVIESMEPTGHRSEFELVYLLRRWTQEKGLDHLISVELGLPREDMGNEKIDIRLIVAGIPYALQMKAEYTRDRYREDFYREEHRKLEAELQYTETQLLAIDKPTLSQVFKDWGKEMDTVTQKAALTRAKHAIIDAVMAQLAPESQEIVHGLTERKEMKVSTDEEPGILLSAKYLFRAANIPMLVRLGLLSESEKFVPEAVTRAKNSLAAKFSVVTDHVKTREAFQSMDAATIKKIAAALRGANG